MPTAARRLLHYTAYGPQRARTPVPWSGSLSRYASDLRATAETSGQPAIRSGMTAVANRLERLAAFDDLCRR